MRLLNIDEISNVSGGLATLDLKEDKFIISLSSADDCLVLKIDEHNIFTFILDSHGMVQGSYVLNGNSYAFDPQLNLFNGSYGLFAFYV